MKESQPRPVDSSAMVERPGILGWVLFRFFYSLKLFRDKDVQTLRGLADQGRLVYVLSHKHVYNALYFNYAFRRFGLPLARTVTVIFTLVFARLIQMLRYLFGGRERRPMRERAGALLASDEAALLFLRK